MVKCCVPECAATGTKIFHAFPTNEDLRRQWIQNTKTFHLSEKELKGYAKVCAYHFRETDFEINCRGQRGLKKNTVPTLRLPGYVVNFQTEHNYTASSSNPSDEPIKKKSKRNATSAVVPSDEPIKKKSKRNATSAVVEPVNDLSADNQNCNVANSRGLEFQFDQPRDVNVVSENLLVEMELLRQKNETKSEYFKLKEAELKEENKQLKKKLSEMSKKMNVNQKKMKKLRQQLKQEKMNKNNVIAYLSKIFNPEQLSFFTMQIKNSGKKRQARRYTAEEKGLSLILYKQSPKNYRFMQKIFLLPCKRTLGRYSAQLAFETGINPKLFDHIKSKVDTLTENEKCCSLSWDEVSLKAHLDYSTTKDQIDGFVDLAYVRTSGFATHALTFMLRGIQIPFKQPIGYFYTDGLKAFQLAEMIKLMTEAVLDTGLNVLISTCDQVRVNVKAILDLMKSNCNQIKIPAGGLLSYKVRDHTIIHCYDPPHLLKGIRNNLITKKLTHHITKRWNVDTSIHGQRRMASWKHIKESYIYSVKANPKLLPNISAEHIEPKKSKMKVSHAAQIFSQTFGNMMLKCSANRVLPSRFADTAEILLFFNDLFDSFNGSCASGKNQLKSAVTKDSVHFAFWNYALSMLSKMEFLDATTGKKTNRTSVLQHFQSTIRGYIEVCKKCFQLNLTEVSIRYFMLNFSTCVCPSIIVYRTKNRSFISSMIQLDSQTSF